MPTSPRLEEALAFTARVHAKQRRKGTKAPYVTHLLAVCALVGEHGGDEDMMIAALLHDAPEDQGGEAMLGEIRDRFGDRVADLVAAETDTMESPKPPWRERKERFIAGMADASDDARLIMAADKLHNAQCILRDLRATGDAVWSKFTGRREGTLWYYRALHDEFARGGPAGMAAELGRVLQAIDAILG